MGKRRVYHITSEEVAAYLADHPEVVERAAELWNRAVALIDTSEVKALYADVMAFMGNAGIDIGERFHAEERRAGLKGSWIASGDFARLAAPLFAQHADRFQLPTLH